MHLPASLRLALPTILELDGNGPCLIILAKRILLLQAQTKPLNYVQKSHLISIYLILTLT